MRELIGREISLVAGGDLMVGFAPERRLPKVTVTAPRVRTVADEMAMRGIVDLNVLLYGPNGQSPLGAPDIDLAFPLTPNIPNEDALRMAISNAAVLEALGELGERMGADHRQIINMLADIQGMNQDNYDALVPAVNES